MPLRISVDLSDSDIAKELIYELTKLHGYGFVVANASDARADKWHEEREKAICDAASGMVRTTKRLPRDLEL